MGFLVPIQRPNLKGRRSYWEQIISAITFPGRSGNGSTDTTGPGAGSKVNLTSMYILEAPSSMLNPETGVERHVLILIRMSGRRRFEVLIVCL